MKTSLYHIIFAPVGSNDKEHRLHQLYLALMLTLIGIGLGLVCLVLTAYAYPALPCRAIFFSYFQNPLLLFLNLLPPVLFVWLFYFIFGRSWCAVAGGTVFSVVLALVNYYKISLRGDPFLASDILLIRTAQGIMGHYTFDLTKEVLCSLIAVIFALLVSIFLMPRGHKEVRTRLIGATVCLIVAISSYFGFYTNEKIYQKTANEALINIWSDVQVFVSRGFSLSFLHSIPDMFPTPPEGYDKEEAAALLAQYSDGEIAQKVTVMGVMLEAFCDLTDFEALAEVEAVQQIYAPWHALETDSIAGDLLTNIFAGGTVETEWQFLTGASQHDTYRTQTDSYVHYFASQGYDTHYVHPGYGWFYNRNNVNRYLGFTQSVFTENGFGELVDPTTAVWHSDRQLVDYLLQDLADSSSPLFSFAVSYQNHGPYSSETSYQEYLTPEATGLCAESCHILNNYLYGVNETIGEYVRLAQTLETDDSPVILVLFGDHKPWLGNENAVYRELGVNFDISTLDGLYNYYATPYLIWANSAARTVLECDFTGQGGDFSPCFLMPRVFDACGWTGPGFMQLAREIREVSPLLHARWLYLDNGTLTNSLREEDRLKLRAFFCAQYYREHNSF